MIKIAIAAENELVSQHFGYSTHFEVFEVENEEILKEERVLNPGHKPGFLPNYLNDMGVKVIIAGGMGQGAVNIFNEKDITVVLGANGSVLETIKKYIKHELVFSGSICQEHSHHDHGCK